MLQMLSILIKKGINNFPMSTDCIFFSRHHTYRKNDGKEIVLSEIGPRFEMKCKGNFMFVCFLFYGLEVYMYLNLWSICIL